MGAPPLSNTGAIRPIQVACRLPLDILHSPLSRWPPSTSSARALTGGPQLSAARGSPQILRATAGSSALDDRRAAVDLADAPGRAGVELGQRLHGPEPGDEVDLLAAVGARQQHAKEPLLVQLVHDLGREPPERLVGRAGFFDHVGDAADALDRPDRSLAMLTQ